MYTQWGGEGDNTLADGSWALLPSLAPWQKTENVCSAAFMSICGAYRTQNGLKWNIIHASAAMEDYLVKER